MNWHEACWLTNWSAAEATTKLSEFVSTCKPVSDKSDYKLARDPLDGFVFKKLEKPRASQEKYWPERFYLVEALPSRISFHQLWKEDCDEKHEQRSNRMSKKILTAEQSIKSNMPFTYDCRFFGHTAHDQSTLAHHTCFHQCSRWPI